MFSCHLQLCQEENQNELAKSCTSSILEGKKKSSFEGNEINPQFKLNFDYSVKLHYTVPITISTYGLNMQANNVSFKRDWIRNTDRESVDAILSLKLNHVIIGSVMNISIFAPPPFFSHVLGAFCMLGLCLHFIKALPCKCIISVAWRLLSHAKFSFNSTGMKYLVMHKPSVWFADILLSRLSWWFIILWYRFPSIIFALIFISLITTPQKMAPLVSLIASKIQGLQKY